MAKIVLAAIGAALLSCGTYGQEATSGIDTCEGLSKLELPGAKMLSAQAVAAGAFTPPANINPRLIGDPSFYTKLSAFCRVVAEATPSAIPRSRSKCGCPSMFRMAAGGTGNCKAGATEGSP